jgi:HEPN domain-containing protein
MINIEKQVTYWRDGAREEWTVAVELMERGRVRHGFFFAHLALEKAIKAHVCLKTRAVAPRSHNLVYLAEQAGLELDEGQRKTLADMNLFSMAGRYPDTTSPMPDAQEAASLLRQAQEVFTWLMPKS